MPDAGRGIRPGDQVPPRFVPQRLAAHTDLRTRVLVPLALAIALTIAIGVLILVYAQRHHEEHASEEAANALRVMLRERTSHDASAMQSLIALLMQDEALAAHFRAGRREALYAATSGFLRDIRSRNSITHLYFLRPDLTTFLRVHRPDEHGDRIDRFVNEQARESDSPSWGYEQGPYGSYTLRVAAPWRAAGELIGYIEMGIEFEDLMTGIRRALNADVFVAIDKPLVDRARWESAQRQRPMPVPWEEFPTVVLLSRTTADVPPDVRQYLQRPRARPEGARFRSESAGGIQRVIVSPLHNLRGELVGELVLVKDVTEDARDAAASLAAIIGSCLAVAAALMVFLHYLLGRVQRDLASRTAGLAEARKVLAAEQDERQRAERELALQQERNELLEGQARMVEELAEARRKAEEALRQNEQVTARLREAQSELLATARAAGRAEIATNVLHNVGNVLNSVNVSAGVIGTTLRNSRVDGLARAMQLVQAHSDRLGDYLTRDEKGRLLVGYLQAVADTLAGERNDMQQELARLVKSVDHIKDIVATQQSHATGGHVIEPVQPSELADDALRMQGTALARHQVTVLRDYQPVPAVPLDRGRVLQILVNLISNAKAAMAGMPGTGHRLTLRIALPAPDRLRFVVEDEGVGIPPENLTRIFAHGFTTRDKGHGFGLHSSALAARDMGGDLRAHSAGVGQGATFVLEIPIAQGSQPAEAAAALAD